MTCLKCRTENNLLIVYTSFKPVAIKAENMVTLPKHT